MPHWSFVVFILLYCCRTLIKGTWMVALSKRHTVVIVATTGFWTGIYSVNKSTWDPWMSGISDMSHPSIKASTKRSGWHTTIHHGRPLLGLSAQFVAFNSCTCKALVVCWNNPMVPQNRFMIHRAISGFQFNILVQVAIKDRHTFTAGIQLQREQVK